MLKNLYIKNYAIIDEINIEFDKGLTIITGETGAGKSILIGALSMVLGERADNGMMNTQAGKCIIEAQLNISTNEQAKNYLKENEFEYSDDLIIRRELSNTGKSRAFINDTPATLSVLTPLSNLLLDLHRQFDTIDLQEHLHQISILDDIAGNKELLSEYAETFASLKKNEKEYDLLVQKNLQIKQELDYNTFTFHEIDSLNWKDEEIESIESELQLLENAEAFKQSLQTGMQLLHEQDIPVSMQIKQVIQQLEAHSKVNINVASVIERLQSCLIEIKDIHSELENEFENVFYDQEKINQLTERLNEGNRLLKKHHVKSTSALLQLKNELEQKIHEADTADDEEKKLLALNASLSAQAAKLAKKLSANRKAKVPETEQSINALLKLVGMPNAAFKIAVTDSEMGKTGTDKVAFLFDANKTNVLKPLSKVASGGELSRLMLCIKSMVASSTELPTLIFDEIDTGISGETAIQVGNIMKQLSVKHQLISITHLPQIASKANQHLYIYKKENTAGKISTHIRKLEGQERIDVLAEMLSGKESSSQAREMVKELMK